MATITLKGKGQALSCFKSGELAQFGLALDLEHVSTGVNLKNICVHLSGGHSAKDQATREEQIGVVTSLEAWQQGNVILAGDFNCEID